MTAVVNDTCGPPEVRHFGDVDRPAPRDDEVLIKIHAATVNRLDCHTREDNGGGGGMVMVLSGVVSGVRAPRQRILGSELAGVVEQAGRAVSEFKVGDRVFGLTGLGFGTYAEYRCMRQSARIAHMPEAMTFEQAAPMCDGALNALWCMRLADLQKRRKVLIYGASGAIGSAAVQLARHFKTHVTAGRATKKHELIKSISAAKGIDYTKEDFTKTGETYDVIFDAVGKQTFARCRASLKPGGAYLPTDGFRNTALTFSTPRFP